MPKCRSTISSTELQPLLAYRDTRSSGTVFGPRTISACAGRVTPIKADIGGLERYSSPRSTPQQSPARPRPLRPAKIALIQRLLKERVDSGHSQPARPTSSASRVRNGSASLSSAIDSTTALDDPRQSSFSPAPPSSLAQQRPTGSFESSSGSHGQQLNVPSSYGGPLGLPSGRPHARSGHGNAQHPRSQRMRRSSTNTRGSSEAGIYPCVYYNFETGDGPTTECWKRKKHVAQLR